MQNHIIYQASTKEEIIQDFKQLFREALIELEDKKNDQVILTRTEACTLLGINKTTLWHYTKNGKLTSYGIGNRVYYKKAEVLDALKPLNIKNNE